MSYLSEIYRKVTSPFIRMMLRNCQYRFIHIFERAHSYSFKPDSTQTWKKTVCFLIPSTKLSGGVAVVCEYANRLQKQGIKSIIATVDGSTDLSWFEGQRVKVVSWAQERKRIQNEFDTIVATGWITAYAVAGSGIKRAFYLVQSDERRFYPEGSFLRTRVNDTYLLPFRFITIAHWMQEWLKKEFGHDSTVIRQGINTDIFRPDGPSVEPRPKEKTRILIEGAIDLPFKGVRESFATTDTLPRDKYEVWLVSSSGVPDPSWKMNKYFHRIPINMMGEIYRSCHVLLKLSTVEGMAGPPLEAMACRCIPVVNRVTGVDEYMIDGENGFIVDYPKDDAQSIISHINEANRLYKEFETTGYTQLDRTVKKFDWEISTKELFTELNI